MAIGGISIGAAAIGATGDLQPTAYGAAVSQISLFISRAKGFNGLEANIPLDEVLRNGCLSMDISNIPTAQINTPDLTAEVTNILDAEFLCQRQP